MGAKEQAEYLFSRIGWGRENAVMRPDNTQVDRILRSLVEAWNWIDGNYPIINVGGGYYKPRGWIPAEVIEYRKYRARDDARKRSLDMKGRMMDKNFFEYADSCHDEGYEQLSLPVKS